MKKYIFTSIITSALLATACTENPSNVYLYGLIDSTSDSCKNPEQETHTYIYQGVIDTSLTNQYYLYLHLRNNASADPVWQSSGSGSNTAGGTTINLPKPHHNTVKIKKMNLTCTGELCDQESISFPYSEFLAPQRSSILRYPVKVKPIDTNKTTDSIELAINFEWADEGVIKGKTNTINYIINVCNNCLKPKCTIEKAKTPSDICANFGQDKIWACPEDEPKDKDSKDPKEDPPKP